MVTERPESLINTGLQRSKTDRQSVARLMDLHSASDYLCLSYWSVRTLVLNGEIPHLRFGRKWLIDVRDLDRWIEQHKEVGV